MRAERIFWKTEAQMKAETIWAITDGKAGMVKQARGLAHAIAREAGGDVVESYCAERSVGNSAGGPCPGVFPASGPG